MCNYVMAPCCLSAFLYMHAVYLLNRLKLIETTLQNVDHTRMMCGAQVPSCLDQGQGHTWSLWLNV